MNPRQATALLEPLRARILSLAQEPASATELALRLGMPRQRVNYHVRELFRANLLRRAGRRRKRNMFEQRYIASARAYVMSPELLGPVQADWRAISDAGSAAYLLALSAQVQSDLGRAVRAAGGAGKGLATVSIKSQFQFEGPEQRERFTRELRDAIVSVIARLTSPNKTPQGKAGRDRAYRLVLGCYPYTPEAASREREGEDRRSRRAE